MGLEFSDLPSWEFTVIELPSGEFRVRAIRDGGISGEASGFDPDSLLTDLKEWARGVNRDLAEHGTDS